MKVFLSPLAVRKIEILISYLQEKWSIKVKNEFISKLTEKFNQIALQPKSCIKSKEFPNLYKCVVNKQTSFFYRIQNNEIEIITIIDNRQNPDKILAELKKYFG